MNTLAMIEMYVASKSNSWASTTLVTERVRLVGLATVINGDPQALWNELDKRGMAPYSRVTTFARVCNFYEWLLVKGHVQGGNAYKLYRMENMRHFKAENVYRQKHVRMTFAEAARLIATMEDAGARDKAMQLLTGGLRYSESFTQNELNVVVGKGGKLRRVFASLPVAKFEGCYTTFLRQLRAATGLTPHGLRKIRATQMAETLKEGDMCKAFGWSSYATAKSYIAPKDEEQIKAAFDAATSQGDDSDDDNTDEQIPA